MRVLLDAGHGGWLISPEHPEGHYPTPGKRSPKHEDGFILYEGVNNRAIVSKLKLAFLTHGIKYYDVVHTEEDKSLLERIKTANKIASESDEPCLYLSIHSNAAGKDGEFSTAKGFGTYIYTRASRKSKDYAKIMHKHLSFNLSELTRDRGIRERNFAVLRETSMPAILLELGFHSHKEESRLIATDRWQKRVVNGIVDAIKEMEKGSV